jgi:hypothetical protein
VKLGTVCYAPPKGKLNSEAFLANLARFPAAHPLFVISDDAANNPSRLITSPERVGRRPFWAINNLIFFAGIELARDIGLNYFIWLESDSRVGCAEWDNVMFGEFMARYPNGISCAGTPICWDLNSGGREFALKVVEMAWNYQQASGLPMSFYSGKHPYDPSGAALYVNGSCAVYDTAALLRIFAGFEGDPAGYAKRMTAYDLEIGRRLWNYHGPRAVDNVGWLSSSYSAFGDTITTEAERLQMLADGRKVLCHQIKGPS